MNLYEKQEVKSGAPGGQVLPAPHATPVEMTVKVVWLH